MKAWWKFKYKREFFSFSFNRFPWNVFCKHTMRNSWTRQVMGAFSILWKINLCRFRRYSTKVSKSLGKKNRKLSSSFYYRLLELVEDCGPLPLANDKCKLDAEATNKTASFPYCCPKFKCDAGAKLEYPEIKEEKGN